MLKPQLMSNVVLLEKSTVNGLHPAQCVPPLGLLSPRQLVGSGELTNTAGEPQVVHASITGTTMARSQYQFELQGLINTWLDWPTQTGVVEHVMLQSSLALTKVTRKEQLVLLVTVTVLD